MTSFLDVVEAEFGSKDLYFVLGVEREAKEGEIRRAYHRLSLRVHPDRVEPAEVDTATKKFQVRVFLVTTVTADVHHNVYYQFIGGFFLVVTLYQLML